MVDLNFFSVNHIHLDKKVLIEGEFRCNELKDHLEKYNCGMSVFLSEDASGIVKRVTYDPKTNQIVGLVLPFNEDGMPKTMSFMPSTAEDIENFMKISESSLVYIMVAQPLTPKVPSFIVQIFGTDNTFKKRDVQARWEKIEKETKR